MCGIFALMSDVDFNLIDTEFRKGKDRGPEHSIIHNEKIMNMKSKFYLGFHRLAINGLNTESNQPLMMDNIILICNGEIYNYKELYKMLDVKPKTDSDCEVIIHLYKKYGFEQTLRMLDGVFAIVLMEKISPFDNKLFIARDPYGVRPLYINHSFNDDETFLAVASDMKMINKLCRKDYELKIKNNSNANVFYDDSEDEVYYIENKVKHFTPGTFSEYSLKKGYWYFEKQKKYITFPIYNMYSNDDENDVLNNIRNNLMTAVKKRVETTDRPIACLLSGGLDSSLICSLVNREITLNGGVLETFSIGLEGSDDLKYARLVAEHLNTKHNEVIVTEKEMLEAIPEVIYKVETYDTTTIRASVGNYLISKYISNNSKAKVIFNGDGADELMGGYLYFHKCPDSIEFDKECKRLLENIHCFDVLRSDKSISSNGLEARTPFLDRYFVQSYLTINPDIRNHNKNKKCEKYLIRKAFDNFEYNNKCILPKEVLWRTKEAFSDGVSKNTRSWYEIIQEHISNIDIEIKDKKYTPEQNYYFMIFEEHYKNQEHIIPYYWMPSYVDAHDSSARTLDIYKEINKQNDN